MKKVIVILCLAGLILASAGCGKNDEKKKEPTATPEVAEQGDEVVEEGIENGGDIDDEGNVVEGSDEPVEVVKPGQQQNEEKPEENVSSGDESGNEVSSEEGKLPENSGVKDNQGQVQANSAPAKEKIELEYDANGNITRQSAIAILQQYTVEQLGLTPNVRHQMLFEEATTTVNSKSCYAIAAKIEGGNTEGVFYVSVDGKVAYKYDLENQKYIKLP